jgi:branched-chain amino acid transport system permease protein
MKYAIGMAVAILPLFLLKDDPHWLNIIAFTYLMGGLASAWNIIGGFGGQFSLGHGVFFGIGAYMTAKLNISMGWSPWYIMFMGAAVAAVVSVLISWPTFRLRGPFFAIATLAFNEVAFVMANHFDSYTGGPRGLMIPFKAGFENMIFKERWQYAVLMFGFVALVVAISVALRRTRLGYYLLAVREDEDSARAFGHPCVASQITRHGIECCFDRHWRYLVHHVPSIHRSSHFVQLTRCGREVCLVVPHRGCGHHRWTFARRCTHCAF